MNPVSGIDRTNPAGESCIPAVTAASLPAAGDRWPDSVSAARPPPSSCSYTDPCRRDGRAGTPALTTIPFPMPVNDAHRTPTTMATSKARPGVIYLGGEIFECPAPWGSRASSNRNLTARSPGADDVQGPARAAQVDPVTGCDLDALPPPTSLSPQGSPSNRSLRFVHTTRTAQRVPCTISSQHRLLTPTNAPIKG